VPEKKASSARVPRPEWLKVSLKTGDAFKEVGALISDHSLHTVCQEARCPNIYECWNQRTATFMILGDVCTRHCGFCSVKKGKPLPLDPEEPDRVAQAAEKMGLTFAVVTSVDRDDLPDGGAAHFAETISAIRERIPQCKVEVLVPDFGGRRDLLHVVLQARPDVLAHNLETVEALYRRVRPIAVYERSLELLRTVVAHRKDAGIHVMAKTGIMVGLGESKEQIVATLRDIAETGCDIVTIGQYLSPKRHSLPVARFYTPAEFSILRDEAIALGIKHVESAPLVRSSYHAHKAHAAIRKIG
jgi:lipoic acid synthetase